MMDKFTMRIFNTILFTTFAMYSCAVYAFFCPTNFNQIDFGMSPEQVTQACGKPDKESVSNKENDNIPQEWSYYMQQPISLSNPAPAETRGTMKTTITFDNQGKAINISVNGIGVGTSGICGSMIQLGDSKEMIKSTCGIPAFINKQAASPDAAGAQGIKLLEYDYLNANPPATLIFENDKLVDKK